MSTVASLPSGRVHVSVMPVVNGERDPTRRLESYLWRLLDGGPLLLPEYRDPHPGRFDLFSAVLSLAAVLLVIYGLKQSAQEAFGLVPALSIAAGLLVGFIFIQRQRTLEVSTLN